MKEPDNEGFDHGYDVGFNDGYRSGADAAWTAGFQDCLNQLYPLDAPLPLGYNLQELVRAGAASVLKDGRVPRLLSINEIATAMEQALQRHRGWSLVMVGDVEAKFLAGFQQEAVQDRYWATIAGIDRSDRESARLILEGIAKAAVVGIPLARHPECQQVLLEALRNWQINPEQMVFTDSTANYLLMSGGLLGQIIARCRPRVVLIGNRAGDLGEFLQKSGVEVVGTVTPVRGLSDARRALRATMVHDFDLALVSAGAAAYPLCAWLGRQGKVALDFGAIADELLSGSRRWLDDQPE